MKEYEGATARVDGRGIWNGDEYRYEEPSLGELLKRLSADMGTLLSQEASLAKAELRESAATAAKGAARLGVALTFAIAGTIALTAFLVIAIGGAIDNYWLSALIVGTAELLVGVVLAKSAMSSMTGPSIKPRETIESLREDKQWVGQEARDLKRGMSGNANTSR